MKPSLLVLAAGIGSRYGGLKQIDKIGPSGETIMDYSIYDAIRAGVEKVVFVIRKEIQLEFHEVIGSRLTNRIEIEYAFQELSMVPEEITCPDERTKPWGTGQAVLVARDKINEPFIVINADDFYGAGSYEVMVDYLMSSAENEYAMVGFRLDKTLSDYGQVARGVCKINEENFLLAIAEMTNIEQRKDGIIYTDELNNTIKISGSEMVSMNIWGFNPRVFDYLAESFSFFLRREPNHLKSEFYIPTFIYELLKLQKATVKVLESRDSWFGVTYKEDKESVVGKIRNLVDEGVYPEKLW